MWWGVGWCGVGWCGVVGCGVVWCGVVAFFSSSLLKQIQTNAVNGTERGEKMER